MQGAPAHPFRIAERMAVNRTVAGVHFPCDSAAGALLGCAIGEHVHALGTGQRLKRMGQDFDTGAGKIFADAEDFTLDWLAAAIQAPQLEPAAGGANAIAAKAWDLAQAEWPAP